MTPQKPHKRPTVAKRVLATRRPTARRRGRPQGSPSLTKALEEKLIAYARTSPTLVAVARAAGISARTLSDWLQRGEGRHPNRPCTPKLKRFAQRFRVAQGEALILHESQLDSKTWVNRADRSMAKEEASQHPGFALLSGIQTSSLSEDELNGALARLLEVIDERVSEAKGAKRRPLRGAA